jgi:alcohol dehydrogenase class IV
MQFCAQVRDKHLTICKALDVPAADAAAGLRNLVDRVRDLLTSLKIPLKLDDFGITSADFEAKLPKLAELTHGDISSILSPRPVTVVQCEKIMRYAYDGKDIDF